MERRRSTEIARNLGILGLSAIALLGCEDILRGGAFTVSKDTSVIWGELVGDPYIEDHEACYRQQIKTFEETGMGTNMDWLKNYITDPVFACLAEVSCGVKIEDHPACSWLGDKAIPNP